MAFRKLTETGKEFIRGVISLITQREGNNSLLMGKNNYNLPFSDKSDESITWVATVFDDFGSQITNNTQFGEYLILLFDRYAEQYNLDANIIAAQAYQESRYKTWNYARTSTASGISQFIMAAVYDGIFTRRFLGTNEKNALILNMDEPELRTSWIGVARRSEYTPDDRERQLKNRSILHQNIINNPAIMIKLQCALMSFIGDRNSNLAANALFAYNRGSSLRGISYPEIINKTAKKFGNDYIKEGVGYVENIFGYLGDRENRFIKTLPREVRGLWFGYKNIDFGFDVYNANVASSNIDTKSSNDINDLIDRLRNAYLNAKFDFEANYNDRYVVELQSVHRSPLRQFELYQVGRTSNGRVVGETITSLDGFNRKSNHNFFKSRAFDYSIYDTELGIFVKGDRNKPFVDYALHGEFAEIVQTYEPNAVWGGNFSTPDPIHIALG